MLFKGNSSRLEFLIEKIQAHKESPSPLPDEKYSSRLKDGILGAGSYSWRSEDDSLTCQRGGGTPSSCATSTSQSFPSETEIDAELRMSIDANNSSGPYSCQFCHKTFPTLSYLKKHEQSHGDQMPYKCSWCARLFKHKRSRDRHVKLHTGDRRYRCTHCDAAFSRSDHLKIHMKTHDNQKPYHCTECSRGYNTAAALTSHMQSHKRPQSSGHYSRSLVENDRRSASWHNGGSPPTINSPMTTLNLSLNPKIPLNYSPESTIIDTPKSQLLQSPITLTCMYCARDTFTTMEQLQLHVHSMHRSILNGSTPSTSPDENTNQRRSNYKETDQNISMKNDSQGLSCRLCAMKFEKLSLLRDHLVSAHRDDGFEATLTCPLCGIPCSSATSYTEHYVLEHCDNGEIATRENNMSNLQRMGIQGLINERVAISDNLHKQIENYSSTTLLCGQCGAALKDFESFRTHLARHLHANQQNLSQISCPKCELSFQNREDMISHLTKHYMGQLTKKYPCSTCKEYFPSAELLQKHLLESHAHHLYRCTLCRDTFDSLVGIQVHFSVKHIQECSVYHCNSCQKNKKNDSEGSKIFKNILDLMDHVRNTHVPTTQANENESPGNSVSTPGVIGDFFRCRFCGIYCTSDLELQHHLASHSTCLYRCPICHEGFTVEFLLDKHIAHSHNVVNGDAEELKNDNGNSRKRRNSPDLVNNGKHVEHSKRLSCRPNNIIHYQCEFCEGSEFTNENELRAHKKLVHKTQNKIQKSMPSHICSYCGEACRSRIDLESHTRLHHAPNEPGKRYKCNICDQIFSSGIILAEHKLEKHCKIQLSDICIVCREILTSEAEFLEHIHKHNMEGIDPQQRLENILPHIPAYCVVCRQTLVSEFECQLHAKYHLRLSMDAQPSDSSAKHREKQNTTNCCICLREFSDGDVVSLPSKCITRTDQQLKVCKRCYLRYSQGLPILRSPYEHCETDNSNSYQQNHKVKWDHTVSSNDLENIESNEQPYNSETSKNLIKVESTNGDGSPRQNQHDDPENRSHDCPRCHVKFTLESELKSHLATHDQRVGTPLANTSEVCVDTPENCIQENIVVKNEIINSEVEASSEDEELDFNQPEDKNRTVDENSKY